MLSGVHNTISCFSYNIPSSQQCQFPTWQEYSIQFWSQSQRNSCGREEEIEPGVVTRARGHAFLPVTKPNIHSCLCYQGQRSCILTCYQSNISFLSLLIGPEIMHTYLLPGHISILVSVTRARGHAFLPVTRPNIHSCLCY
jgi:hypothetical protein